MHLLTDLLGWTLAVAGAAASIPQMIHTIRTRATDGLSLMTEVLWIVSWALWLGYGITITAWPKITGDGLGLLAEVAVIGALLAALHRTGRLNTRTVLIPAVVAVTATTGILAAGHWGGLHTYAIALMGLDAVALAPLLWTTMRSKSLAGVSLTSWTVKVAIYAGWIVYGLGIGEPLSSGWAYLTLPVGAAIIGRTLLLRRRAAGTTPPPSVDSAARDLQPTAN